MPVICMPFIQPTQIYCAPTMCSQWPHLQKKWCDNTCLNKVLLRMEHDKYKMPSTMLGTLQSHYEGEIRTVTILSSKPELDYCTIHENNSTRTGRVIMCAASCLLPAPTTVPGMWQALKKTAGYPRHQCCMQKYQNRYTH